MGTMRGLGLVALVWVVGCRSSSEPPGEVTDTGEPVEPIGSDVALSSLSLEGAELRPAFDPDLRYYWVYASELGTLARVRATTATDDATVKVRAETPDGEPVAVGPDFTPQDDLRVRLDVTSGDGAQSRSYAVALLPDDFPTITTEGEAGPGWTFLNISYKENLGFTNALVAVDGNGTPGWWRSLAKSAHDVRLAPDGRVTWLGRTEELPSTRQSLVLGEEGGFDVALGPGDVPADWELTEVDEHELEIRDDGTMIRMLNYRVMEDLSPWGGPSEQRVLHMMAQELDLDGNVLFEFSTEGIIPYDELPPNLSDDMDELDWEPIHFNSIDVDPYDGHWVVSMQRVSVIAKFARTGPQAGEMLWQLSGEGSDFTFVDDPRDGDWVGIGGQHSARVSGPDRILVFDNANGDQRERGDVRVVEYQLDLDTMEASKVWERPWVGRGRAFAGGSVQRLTGGGHVVDFGSLTTDANGERVPTVTELDAADEEVWSLFLPDGHWSYRAWRFEGDPMEGGWVVTPGGLPE